MIIPSAFGRPGFDDGPKRHFDPMGRQQCLEFIASDHLGRIAWQAADLPQILPITYAMHRGSTYFRSLPDGLLAQLAQPVGLALEVDELEQQTRSGRSIVLHGYSSAAREPDELADLWASDSLVPWASGNHTLLIRIRPDRIAGRVVRRPT